MSLCVVIYLDGHRQMLGDDSKASAIEAYQGLKAKQPEVVATVKRVILPPSWMAELYPGHKPRTADDTTHLTNEGIQQGMYSAIPNGDR